VASVTSAVDKTLAPTGTSVVTLTGTALDAFNFRMRVAKGGTIGTAGCRVDVSLDGGRRWIRNISLGAAVTYVIANSGLTVNFAAGTLVLGEIFTATTTEPMWDEADLAAMFAALKATATKARVLILTGTLTTAAQFAAVGAAVEAYRTDAGRPMRAIVNVRDRFSDLVLEVGEELTVTMDDVAWSAYAAGPPVVPGTATRSTGSWEALGVLPGMKCDVSGSDLNTQTGLTVAVVTPTVLTFANTDVSIVLDADDDSVTFTFHDDLAWTAYAAGPPAVPGTVVRKSGSWVTDGVQEGMRCAVTNSDLNNAAALTVETVAAKTLTFAAGDTGVVVDAADAAATFSFSEPEVDWFANLGAELDSTYQPRVCPAGGHSWWKSGLTGWTMRRPNSVAIGAHYMKGAIQRSAARVKSGACDGVLLHDPNGDLIEHDERVTEGLLEHRISTLRTYDSKGGGKAPPVYVALPVLMHSPGSDFSRLQIGCLVDKVEQVINAQLEDELSDDVELKSDNTMVATERARITEAVNDRVDREVVKQKEASSVTWTMATDDVFTPDGGTVHGEGVIRYRGYIEKFETVYRLARPANG
jgi:hypothetical protein